jgi:hypothetical protein
MSCPSREGLSARKSFAFSRVSAYSDGHSPGGRDLRLNPIAAALFALLALSQPSVGRAQAAPTDTTLHPAWIDGRGSGDIVVYVADNFWQSPSKSAASLYVITIQRGNPGDALNSIAADINGLQQYLKPTNGPGWGAGIVAIELSRNLIRFFFRTDDQAFIASFHYPRAELSKATAEDFARLSAIGIADFARFIARRAVVQANTERQFLGPHIPVAEQRKIELKLRIKPGSPADSETLAAALRKERFGPLAPEISVTAENGEVQLLAHFLFSEALVQSLIIQVCADVSRQEAECVDWKAKFDTIRVKL